MLGYLMDGEDGIKFRQLDLDEMYRFLENPREYAGVERFLRDIPDEWRIGDCVLMEFKVLEPKQKTVAWRLD